MSNIGDMLVDVKGLKSVHDNIKSTFSTKQELTNVDNKFSEVNSARQSGNGTTYNNLKARLDADKEAVEADVDKLKADLGGITSNLPITGWSGNNKYIDLSGSTANVNTPSTSVSNFVRCVVVPAEEGDLFTITATGHSQARAYGFVANDGTILFKEPANTTVTEKLVMAPQDCYLVINNMSLTGESYYGKLIKNRVEDSEKNIDANSHDINAINKQIWASGNLYDYTKISDGYIGTNGVVHASTMLSYTDKIYVDKDDVLTAYYYNQLPNSIHAEKMRFVCAYDKNGVPLPTKGLDNDYTYTVPDGVDYVVVSSATSRMSENKYMVVKNQIPTKYLDYIPPLTFNKLPNALFDDTFTKSDKIASSQAIGQRISQETAVKPKFGKWVRSGNLSDGQELVFENVNISNNRVYAFTAEVTSFSGLKIGDYANSKLAPRVEIDDTYVTVYSSAEGTQPSWKQAHGLTFVSNIQVILETTSAFGIEALKVISNGNEFDYSVPASMVYGEAKGTVKVISDGSTLTNCVASYTSRNINKRIWLIGDSYMSTGNDKRWTYYADQLGYIDNVLVSAYAGGGSENALTSLENLLEVSCPDIIVWALGMNDVDDVNSSGAVNEAWNTAYESLKTLCDEKKITLILATIPNTPKRNMTYKNAIVRNSGYRYIDFAKAVNAESYPASWYSGMLSNDNVHPTEAGARTLFMQVICDFPELSIKNN